MVTNALSLCSRRLAMPPQQVQASRNVAFADALESVQMSGVSFVDVGQDQKRPILMDCIHFDDEILGFAA